MKTKINWKVKALIWVFTCTLLLLWIFPLFRMFQISFQGKGFGNYKTAIETEGFFRNFLNSCYVTSITLLLSTFSIVTAAYAFSKLNFPLKNFLFLLCIMGMMIAPASLIVPVFLQTQKLGWINNLNGIIGPCVALTLPFGTLIVKAFFDDIPNPIIEAASIDGASKFRILLNIIVPIGRPAIATVLIFNFLTSWKDFLFPFIMLNDYNKMTVALLPQRFIESFASSNEHVIYAVLVLSSLPVFIVYLFGEKKIESGLTAGAVK